MRVLPSSMADGARIATLPPTHSNQGLTLLRRLPLHALPFRRRLLFRCDLWARPLGEALRTGFAIPFLECLRCDLPLDEQLGEFATLRLTLERHSHLLRTRRSLSPMYRR